MWLQEANLGRLASCGDGMAMMCRGATCSSERIIKVLIRVLLLLGVVNL